LIDPTADDRVFVKGLWIFAPGFCHLTGRRHTGHGVVGRLLEAIEARGGINDGDLCICGSGRRYARCHKQPLVAYQSQKSAA
jgi:hypothetical protein